MKKIFIIPFHVKRVENSIMPSELDRAYVSCYSLSETYVQATKNALEKLKLDGLYPEEILEPIYELEPNSWSQHIEEQWSKYADYMPTQEEFNERMASDDIVYGPFASYRT